MEQELYVCVDPEFEKSIQEAKRKNLVSFKNFSGVAGQKPKEINVNYNQTSGESVYNNGNSFLILGPDRNAGVTSGWGGVGSTAAAAIDICAGLGGIRPINTLSGEKVTTNKDFDSDSSRIYLSQFSNIDEYFSLPEYKLKLGSSNLTLDDSRAKSGIGIKSDCIRIISRENIRLVTSHLGRTAREQEKYIGGIELIAGYDIPDEEHMPQPMVKGDNLVKLLKEIISLIENVQSTVTTFLDTQRKINLELLSHTHQSGAGGMPTSIMIDNQCVPLNLELITDTLPDILSSFAKMTKANGKFKIGTPENILSKFNKVN